jgi:predicted RNA-binding Zn ribbon-like protein
MSPHPHESRGVDDAPHLADHLALDLLNTEAQTQSGVVDYWATDEDVRRWLARHDVPLAQLSTPAPPGLLARGRELRAAIRTAVSARKSGLPVVIDALNEHLKAYLTAPQLLYSARGGLVLSREARGDAVASLLGPVAEAAASLLVEGDFSLVRQCEHPDCILWFYDRTKSHKRRWCSMAVCGNRHKATRFRERTASAGPSRGTRPQ